MTTFRHGTSFPYLAFARAHEIDYAALLRAVDSIERHEGYHVDVVQRVVPNCSVLFPLLDAIQAEHDRRAAVVRAAAGF